MFDAVEVNAGFYYALRPTTFARWREATPAAFRFCLKAHRRITHVQRLAVDRAAIVRERDRAAALGDELAVVLWQLPQGLQRDLPRLRGFLRQLAVQSDAADWPLWPAVTTDLAYVRLHGRSATYRSRYSARQLAAWAERIAAWRRQGRAVWAFFDNTDQGHAPRDALRLRRRCERR